MKKYNAVIFDLDGTLMNTLGDLLDATNYMLEKYGYPLVDMEKLRKAVGNGALNQLRCCFPDTVTEEELLSYVEEYKPYYALHCEEKTAPYEGVAALLTELKNRGVPMAIVTNKPDEAAQRLCKRWFGEWIELFIGERPGIPRKPAGDMVHLAIGKLGVKAEDTVYVGDSEVDLATARNSGLDCISCLWGFRDKEMLVELGAENLAEKPADILNWVG